MEIQINNPQNLLNFVRRKDVSAEDAIRVFGESFKVVPIIFIDSITRKSTLKKDNVVTKIERFIEAAKNDPKFNKSIVIF